MTVQLTAVMLGVKDLKRSKAFYGDGLGCKIDKDYPNFVQFDLGGGSFPSGALPVGRGGRRGRCLAGGFRLPGSFVPLRRPVE